MDFLINYTLNHVTLSNFPIFLSGLIIGFLFGLTFSKLKKQNKSQNLRLDSYNCRENFKGHVFILSNGEIQNVQCDFYKNTFFKRHYCTKLNKKCIYFVK